MRRVVNELRKFYRTVRGWRQEAGKLFLVCMKFMGGPTRLRGTRAAEQPVWRAGGGDE